MGILPKAEDTFDNDQLTNGRITAKKTVVLYL